MDEHKLETIIKSSEQLPKKLLLYFHFYQSLPVEQEINFLVATCSQFTYFTQGEIQHYYQFYQRFVQLSSHNPGYLISPPRSTTTITINSVTGNTNGTFKAYLTTAHHLAPHDGGKYNVCYYIENYKDMDIDIGNYDDIDIKKCLSKQQSSKRFYIYYHFHKERSWNKASAFCKSKGGFLPIVRSREEQDEILRIFYNYALISRPKIGLYLGLSIHKVSAFCNKVNTVLLMN